MPLLGVSKCAFWTVLLFAAVAAGDKHQTVQAQLSAPVPRPLSSERLNQIPGSYFRPDLSDPFATSNPERSTPMKYPQFWRGADPVALGVYGKTKFLVSFRKRYMSPIRAVTNPSAAWAEKHYRGLRDNEVSLDQLIRQDSPLVGPYGWGYNHQVVPTDLGVPKILYQSAQREEFTVPNSPREVAACVNLARNQRVHSAVADHGR